MNRSNILVVVEVQALLYIKIKNITENTLYSELKKQNLYSIILNRKIAIHSQFIQQLQPFFSKYY